MFNCIFAAFLQEKEMPNTLTIMMMAVLIRSKNKIDLYLANHKLFIDFLLMEFFLFSY